MPIPRSLALLVVAFTSAFAEEFVYLKPIGSPCMADRFELLDSRPHFLDRDILQVRRWDVNGLEKVPDLLRSGEVIYLVKTSFGSLPARYEVRSHSRSVSYLQSIGGGAPSHSHPRAPLPAAATAPIRAATPRLPAVPSQAPSRPQSKRPFGWPPYDNPLERRPYR